MPNTPSSLAELTSTPMGQEPMNFEVTKNGNSKYRVKRVVREGDLKPTQGGKRKSKSKSKKSKSKSKKTRRHRK